MGKRVDTAGVRDGLTCGAPLVPRASYCVTRRVRPLRQAHPYAWASIARPRDNLPIMEHADANSLTRPGTKLHRRALFLVCSRGRPMAAPTRVYDRQCIRVGASIARPRDNLPILVHADANSYPVGLFVFALALCYGWSLPRTSDARPYAVTVLYCLPRLLRHCRRKWDP